MPDRFQQEQVSDKVLTAPNIITFIRLMMVPLFLWLIFGLKNNVAGLVVFAVAACTDWVDGQVARRTHQVSKVGKLLDPLVDRLLLASGVVTVCLLERLPVWVVVVLVVRDVAILAEGRYMLSTVGKVPAVVYVGKFATAFLLFGYSFLMLGVPWTPGLGIAEISWLPGLGSGEVLFGIWLIYLGLVCSLVAFAIYQVKGIRMFVQWRHTAK